MSITYKQAARVVGDQLRQVRQSLGLSLAAVEDKSQGRWKAVVVGSYERADRAITVGRLMELCDWYGVDPAEVLRPARQGPPEDARTALVRALGHVSAAGELLACLASEHEPPQPDGPAPDDDQVSGDPS